MNFEQLREKHQKFIYESFEVQQDGVNLKIHFNFTITPNIKFRPEITLPNIKVSEEIINLVFHLGMVELLSYWKSTCSPQIIIKAGSLNQEQIVWWKNLLIKGLGEFFYINKIDFTQNNLVEMIIESDEVFPQFKQSLKNRDLLLIAGGKDSAVTLDIFNQSTRDFDCLMLNPTQASTDVVKKGGCKDSIVIKRTIDPKLLELNSQGYLNGHTPFSAYLAFLSSLTAVLYDYKNLIVSNESSSNEGNVEYLGQEINHQYSKTLEFENLFRDYCQKYLSPKINYLSFLRPLTELKIAEVFSGMTKYHHIFRSCNRGSKQNLWCGECAKCLFAFIILYPFLETKTTEIFGKNLLDDQTMLQSAEDLIRTDNQAKPFDCVGMADETKAAMYLGLIKTKNRNEELPFILDQLKDLITSSQETVDKMLNNWSDNNLSDDYQTLLKKHL